LLLKKKGFKDNGDRIGAFAQILNEVEVTRILILLLLQPSPYKLNPEHEKLLQRYGDIDSLPADYVEEDLYLMLQSLMIAIEEKNERAILHLEKDIWPKLNSVQSDILNRILNKYHNMLIIPFNNVPMTGGQFEESTKKATEVTTVS